MLFVYGVTGVLAGLGGVILASQLKSGSPKYGELYELYVIAAVVVGGTSLSGGEGRILGTLIGAFLIAVIRNGMNLTGVESYTQKVVLGAVIVGAVALDRLKQVYWRGHRAWAVGRRGHGWRGTFVTGFFCRLSLSGSVRPNSAPPGRERGTHRAGRVPLLRQKQCCVQLVSTACLTASSGTPAIGAGAQVRKE